MIIELAQELGLHPKRTSSTSGGEFHSPCPDCGGKDRFTIWSMTERYWCRQCKKAGDVIQFCRDFMGMNFHEACSKVGKGNPRSVISHKPIEITRPGKSWKEKAAQFVEGCHTRLLTDVRALEYVKERGLTQKTIQEHSLGWNPITLYPKREEWGLEKKIEKGKEKKLWVPSGIVIPSLQEQNLHKIKIRRNDWKEGDSFGKYYILPGSLDCIPILGDSSREVVIVVEAELDAMLVVQEAGEFSCCIALGGAQKRPDDKLHEWITQKELIIFALDFDEAGKKEYSYWRSRYFNLLPWPIPIGKSPGDGWKLGIDLNKWVLSGIKQLKSLNSKIV